MEKTITVAAARAASLFFIGAVLRLLVLFRHKLRLVLVGQLDVAGLCVLSCDLLSIGYISCAVVLSSGYTPEFLSTQHTNPEQSNDVDNDEPPQT